MMTPTAAAFFAKWGYVRVPGAFAEQASLRMQDWLWQRMRHVHGIERDNPQTWQVPWPATHLTEQQSGLSPARMATPAFHAAADSVFDAYAWRLPDEWSGALVSFPALDDSPWTIPNDGWHWDTDVAIHLDGPHSLFTFAVFSHLEPQGGGTLLLAGSHHLLHRFYAAMPPAERAKPRKKHRAPFLRSSPYLAALTGNAPSPGDRIAHFMAPADDNGVTMQVVEVTGQPGDAFICHPALLHAVSTNRRQVPRMMRITHAQASRTE